MKYPDAYRPSRSRSTWAKMASVVSMSGAFIIGIWTVIHLSNWLAPNLETASSLQRFGAYLIIPAFIVIFLTSLFSIMLLFVVIGGWLRIGANGEESVKEHTRDDERKNNVPSTWPYWLLVLFASLLFMTGLFFIGQDMAIRHFPSEDWAIIAFAILLLGIPAGLGIMRIRQIHRGEPVAKLEKKPAKALSPFAINVVIASFVVVLSAAGIFALWRIHEFLKIAQPATGTVTRWVYHHGYRSYHINLEVRYQAQDGIVRTLESKNASGFMFLVPTVGQTVPLLYNPNDPPDFRINQVSELWSGPLFCFSFAAIFLITGIIGYIRRMHAGQNKEAKPPK